MRPYLFDKLEPVHYRHHDIEHRRVIVGRCYQIICLAAVKTAVHAVAGSLELLCDYPVETLLVLGKQNTHWITLRYNYTDFIIACKD